jgi:hypothetical protein
VSAAVATLARTRHAIVLQMAPAAYPVSRWRSLGALAGAGGALLALGHRWRLLSVTGVLVGLARSSPLPSLLLSTLTAVASRRVQLPRTEPIAGVPWRNIDAT